MWCSAIIAGLESAAIIGLTKVILKLFGKNEALVMIEPWTGVGCVAGMIIFFYCNLFVFLRVSKIRKIQHQFIGGGHILLHIVVAILQIFILILFLGTIG